MVFINKSLLAGLFALAGAGVLASVTERASCSTPSGVFTLYSVSDGPDGTSQVGLVKLGTDENNNIISTLTTCDDCDQVPIWWNLNASVLINPVFNYAFFRSKYYGTVNYPLPNGQVNFFTGILADITPAPIYCVEKNSTSSSGLLAANGHTDLFSICSFTGTPGPAYRRDIYYNQTSSDVALDCQSTKLVVESFVPATV